MLRYTKIAYTIYKILSMSVLCLSLLMSGIAYAGESYTTEGSVKKKPAVTRKAKLIKKLTPLSVRGTNYYPQATPWNGMFARTPDSVIAADMARVADLNINTVRTFIIFNEPSIADGLFSEDGSVSDVQQAKIDRMLELAWQHNIRMVLCFSFEFYNRQPKIPQREVWQRAMRAIVEPRKNDGRILMWDLMNEPERLAMDRIGLKADGNGFNLMVNNYLKESMEFIRKIDRNHLITIGQAFRIDQLADVVLPDITVIHNYAPKAEMFTQGTARTKLSLDGYRKTGKGRPIVIGEFGISTNVDPVHGVSRELDPAPSPSSGTEEEQRRYYEIIFKAAEESRLPGVMSWCLYDYNGKPPSDLMFGMIRLDGSEKPSAELTRQTYARWAKKAPKP